MHEASLMNGLMRQIEQVAQKEGAIRVKSITVWLGALSHMSHAHFCDHFDVAAKGTIAEAAKVRTILSEDTSHKDAQTIILESVEVETPEP